jgi:UDP-N-acetylmuramate dehydrogenase
MIDIRNNVPLLAYNTFGIASLAATFVASDNAGELADYLHVQQLPPATLILGGGSNILFVSDHCEMVIHPTLKGIEVTEDKETVLVRAYAGETWDDLVAYCVAHNYSGIENLSAIPGTVGACPVQNIGAYGVEAKDVIEQVETLELSTGKTVLFNNDACQFAYRDSFFKHHKGKYLVTAVSFRLSKTFAPDLRYAGLEAELSREKERTLGALREAVIRIRRQKLPDYRELGNAGSFFKNPAIPIELSETLKQSYADIPLYPATTASRKVSAAWLIQQCGWKGIQKGTVGACRTQPLILVNHGHATGKEVLDFAKEIIESVEQKFGIRMEPEVNIV